MEKQSNNALTIILIILLTLILVFLALIIFMNRNNEQNTIEQNTIQNEAAIDNETVHSDVVSIFSTYGKAITDYLPEVFVMPEAYKGCMPEFDDIQTAPKDYLAVCASFKAMKKVDDIYSAKSTLADFNTALVEIFGKEADGLLSESDLESVFFVEKNSDGTYHFNGFDGSEARNTNYSINYIEKVKDRYIVSIYEYITEIDDPEHYSESTDPTKVNVLDRDKNLIFSYTIKAFQEGNMTTYKQFNDKDEEIADTEEYIVSNYSDKLSSRNIILEYDNSTNTFKMVRNIITK